jgi:hypothetical protein
MPLKPKNKTVMWGLVYRENGEIVYAEQFKPKKGPDRSWTTWSGHFIYASMKNYRLARVEVREIKKKV